MGNWLFAVLAAFFLSSAAVADPPEPVESLPWADVTGDGVPEVIRLREVVRDGLNGYDFGVWNTVGDQYLGNIAQMPGTPGMFGYSFSIGPDLDGDKLPELWIADPAAREFVNGRGCVYVYTWQHPLVLLRLQGPGTDTLGTDLRIVSPDSGQTWSVRVASHFQDVFGHVYERWNTFSATGELLSTDEPSAATLVLKSGDVDKNLSADPADVAKVYAKAAEMMAELGITGEKHDEDLDGDDFVDAADILKVLEALGVPEPQAAALTPSAVYNVAPQRGLGACTGPCAQSACCRDRTCGCAWMRIEPNDEKPRGGASNRGWWKPQPSPGGTVLPPGAYPDRRVVRDPLHPPEPCDGFRILPGDIEPGGIMLPAGFNFGTDTVTARVNDPTVAQFSADAAGVPMPYIAGGDIQLRASLTNAQMRVAQGRIKVYGLVPGETTIIIEVTMRGANGAPETQEFEQPVKVGGRVEAQLKTARRWRASDTAWDAHDAAYAAAEAAQALAPEPAYVGTAGVVIPARNSGRWSLTAGPGIRRGLRGSASDGDGTDMVRVYDACDEEITKPLGFFSKRLFLGTDGDGDGISDPTDEPHLHGQYVNHQRIEQAIADGKGPFDGSPLRTLANRAQVNPGSEIMVVLVGQAAERMRGEWARNVPSLKQYYFPKVFGDLISDGRTLPNGDPDFERWGGRDAGNARYTPEYHKFVGVAAHFGRTFAPAEDPLTLGGYQQQSLTGATFPVPIMNSAVFEALETNFNRHVVLGQAKLFDPSVQGEYVPELFEFKPWQAFGATNYGNARYDGALQLARSWVTGANGDPVSAAYWSSSGLPVPQVSIPMSDEEWQEMMEEIGDDGEGAIRSAIFWTETATGFIPAPTGCGSCSTAGCNCWATARTTRWTWRCRPWGWRRTWAIWGRWRGWRPTAGWRRCGSPCGTSPRSTTGRRSSCC